MMDAIDTLLAGSLKLAPGILTQAGATNSQVLAWNGSAWAPATAVSLPITNTGDLIYSSAGSTAARLGIGTNVQVLTSNGTIPVWGAVTKAMLQASGATSPLGGKRVEAGVGTANASGVLAISFAAAFGAAPTVIGIVDVEAGDARAVVTITTAATTTGVTLTASNGNTGGGINGAVVNWVAIGT